VHSRIERLVYGTTEPKAGVVESAMCLLDSPFFNHKIEKCGGILANEASSMMSDFFKMRREGKKKLKQASKNKPKV
jgi:tRNA(adenine34) deaminase